MSTSDFFLPYLPAFLFLIAFAIVAFALECIVGAVALVLALAREPKAVDWARVGTTDGGTSSPPTVHGQPSTASSTAAPTTGHGPVDGRSRAANDDTWRRCSICDQVRNALRAARRAVGGR